MPSKNRLRGNALEYAIVKDFKDYGAVRAWGSNGKSLGMEEDVDVYVPELNMKIQAKKKRKLPDWVGLTSHITCSIVQEDRGKRFMLIEVDKFLDLIRRKS